MHNFRFTIYYLALSQAFVPICVTKTTPLDILSRGCIGVVFSLKQAQLACVTTAIFIPVTVAITTDDPPVDVGVGEHPAAC